MNDLLKQLLNQLEAVGSSNEEIYDSECRDRMGESILSGFVRQKEGIILPVSFGLHSAEANGAVRLALTEYIGRANQLAATLGITAFHERLAAFQNGAIKSDREGAYFDDFFGYSSPDAFIESGEVRTSK